MGGLRLGLLIGNEGRVFWGVVIVIIEHSDNIFDDPTHLFFGALGA